MPRQSRGSLVKYGAIYSPSALWCSSWLPPQRNHPVSRNTAWVCKENWRENATASRAKMNEDGLEKGCGTELNRRSRLKRAVIPPVVSAQLQSIKPLRDSVFPSWREEQSTVHCSWSKYWKALQKSPFYFIFFIQFCWRGLYIIQVSSVTEEKGKGIWLQRVAFANSRFAALLILNVLYSVHLKCIFSLLSLVWPFTVTLLSFSLSFLSMGAQILLGGLGVNCLPAVAVVPPPQLSPQHSQVGLAAGQLLMAGSVCVSVCLPADDCLRGLPPQGLLLQELFQHPGPAGGQRFSHLLRHPVSELAPAACFWGV